MSVSVRVSRELDLSGYDSATLQAYPRGTLTLEVAVVPHGRL